MACVRCGSTAIRRDGQTRLGGQRWRCADCQRRFTARSPSAFSRHGTPWLAEHGLTVDRSTIYRWVQRFLLLFQKAARAYR